MQPPPSIVILLAGCICFVNVARAEPPLEDWVAIPSHNTQWSSVAPLANSEFSEVLEARVTDATSQLERVSVVEISKERSAELTGQQLASATAKRFFLV